MSLVDAGYGSDDDDDVVEAEEEEDVELPTATTRLSVEENVRRPSVAAPSPSTSPSPSSSSTIAGQSGRGIPRQSASTPSGSSTRIRLPDVSELLGPSGSDLTAATSDNQRKRPAMNGSGLSLPHPKLPRGTLHPSRVSPDTAGGLLMPPQLRGRSNVATEDLDKIFSRKQRK